MRRSQVVTLAIFLAWPLISVAGRGPNATEPVAVPSGTVMAIGGGSLDASLYREFVRRAGKGRLAVIPTADIRLRGALDSERLRGVGAADVSVVAVLDRRDADTTAVVTQLDSMDGVWVSGGSEAALVDAILDTSIHAALKRLLGRGGIIAGNSAGASALGELLIRGGAPASSLLVDPAKAQGLGFVKGFAIDQHLFARGRERALDLVIERYPPFAGLGIDEGTAAIIVGNHVLVVGDGYVVTYGTRNGRVVRRVFSGGQEFFLATESPD